MSYDSKKKTMKVDTDPLRFASVEVGETWASVTGGDPKNFVLADDRGVHIGGNLNYQGMPNQMIFGGISKFALWPMLFLPIGPTLVPHLPLANLVSLVKEVKGLVGLLP
jgi:hypothetical protein